MQPLSTADREALLSDILNQAIAAIGRYRIYAEQPSAANNGYQWCIDYLSPGYEILYGHPPEELIANPEHWRSQVHPEDWQAWILSNLALVHTVQGAEPQTIAAEYRIYHKDSSLRWISESLTIRRDEAANGWTVTSLAVDITDRKRTEILLEVQNQILAQIAKGKPLPQILNSLMVAIEAQLNGALCSILLLDGEGKLQHGAAPHLPETYTKAVNGILPGEGVGSCGTAVFRRERVIVSDIATDSLWQNYKSLALQHGLRACWSMPILTPEGRVVGTFAVYYREPRSPRSAELEVITLATNIAEIAIARCQFETTLRDSEAKSRAIIATIPDLMFRASRDGRYLEYFTYHRSFDILPNHVNPTGQWIADFVPSDMLQRTMVAIQQALETQTLQVYEQHIQVGDRWRYEEVRVAPSGTDEVLFIIRDISERKQAEAERRQMQALLQQSEKEFRALVENSPDIIERFDSQMRHLYVSPSLEKLLGLPAQAFIGKTCQELGLDTAMVNLWETAMQAVLATGQKQSVEFVCQIDDRLHSYEALVVPEFADDGTIESMLCISRDVSDRKQAERTLRNLVNQLEHLNDELEAKVAARTVELRDSEERFRSMYEQSPLGISITDLEGRLTRINSSLSQLTGYSEAELLGKYYLDLVYPDDRPEAAQLFQHILHGGQQQTVSEKRYLTKAGDEVWVSVTRATIRDRQGQPAYFIGMVQDIRDRKHLEAERHQAQLELQAQQEFLQRVIDSVPSCIFVKDAEGYIQVINQATVELYDTTVEATLGKRVTEFDSRLSSAQRDIFNLEDQTVVQTGQPLVKQDYIVTHNQQTRWYQTMLKPFVDCQGQVQGLIGNSVDITDRKLAELALQESETRYRQIVETAGEGIWMIDADDKITFANDRMAQLLGTTVNTLMGRTLFDFMDEDGKRLAEGHLAHRHPGIDEQHDFKFKRMDGSDLWAIIETTPIQGADGHYQGTLGMVTDITDRKRIETQLRNLSDRLSLAIKSGAIGIWDWDLVQQVTVWDDRMCELFGVPRAEFTGSTETWLQVMHPDDRPTALASTEQALRGEKDYDTEFRVVQPDGSIRFIKAYGVVQRDEAGKPLRMIGINLDISDRKQAEEKLREANQTLAIANTELARANRLKDEFLANMSHELRTPLNAVLGLSQVLQEEAFGPLNDKQHQFVDNILSSGHHLLSLINDILDLAKIESGKFDLERSPTSIHFLCESSLNFVRQQAQQKHISLEAQLSPEFPLILLDERRMRQVLINLLSNGVKFTPTGGRVTLRVSDLNAHWLLFEVEDTGIGIATCDQDKLFQPFVQIDSSLSRHYEGTGLGLVLVKQIVELHEGQVSVTSELGKGSCFTVRIPYHSISPSPLPHSPSLLPLPLSTPPPIPPPLILLAEDNEDMRQLLQDYLQVNGFRVMLAQNGVEALHIAQTHLPQMILMDIQMPDMDGLEAIQRLKVNSETAMIPVIAVTASVMRGDRERCLAAGANDYLSKPLQLHQLMAKLNDWLPAQFDWSLDGSNDPL